MGNKFYLNKRIFSGLDALPQGKASKKITKGCIVLEGGAFRGLYSAGVLDALMQVGINMECTIGVSAGAMNGMSYVSGQIGRSACINLKYRHDKRYVGIRTIKSNHGIIGFDFLFEELKDKEALAKEDFFRPDRRFVVVATSCQSGHPAYFEKGKCSDIFQAVRASASMPYCSGMVWLDDVPYLDGGCSDSIPYEWAINQGYEKIVVDKTRTMGYRKKVKYAKTWLLERAIYHAYPQFEYALENRNAIYNRQCDKLEELERKGQVFVISPSKDLGISRLEPDMEKLGALYYLGYSDMKRQKEELEAYLGII